MYSNFLTNAHFSSFGNICWWIKAAWWLFNHFLVSWICLPHCTASFCSSAFISAPSFYKRITNHSNYHSVKNGRKRTLVHPAPHSGNSSSECMMSRGVGARGPFVFFGALSVWIWTAFWRFWHSRHLLYVREYKPRKLKTQNMCTRTPIYKTNW